MPLDPMAMALIAAGGGLSQAAGPSRYPVGFGQALSMGAQQGLGGYMAAQQMGQQQRLQDLEAMQTMLAMREMQRKQQQDESRNKAVSEWAATLPADKRALVGAYPDVAAKYAADAAFSMPEQMTPYQQESLALRRAELANAGRMTPYQSEMVKLARERAQGTPDQPWKRYENVGGTLYDPATREVIYDPDKGNDPRATWLKIYQNERRSYAEEPEARAAADRLTQELFGENARTPLPEAPAAPESEGGFEVFDPSTWLGRGDQTLEAAPSVKQQMPGMDLPMTGDGRTPDQGKLKAGERYTLPNGEVATWDGRNFVVE